MAKRIEVEYNGELMTTARLMVEVDRGYTWCKESLNRVLRGEWTMEEMLLVGRAGKRSEYYSKIMLKHTVVTIENGEKKKTTYTAIKLMKKTGLTPSGAIQRLRKIKKGTITTEQFLAPSRRKLKPPPLPPDREIKRLRMIAAGDGEINQHEWLFG